MSFVKTVGSTLTDDGSQWLPVVLRGVAAVVLLPAALEKFLGYGTQSDVFVALGVPMADITVLVVGIVELVVGLALVFGVLSRLAAVTAVVVMVAAITFVGIVPSNAVVLLAGLGIIVLGPGRYTGWNPELLGSFRG